MAEPWWILQVEGMQEVIVSFIFGQSLPTCHSKHLGPLVRVPWSARKRRRTALLTVLKELVGKSAT